MEYVVSGHFYFNGNANLEEKKKKKYGCLQSNEKEMVCLDHVENKWKW